MMGWDDLSDKVKGRIASVLIFSWLLFLVFGLFAVFDGKAWQHKASLEEQTELLCSEMDELCFEEFKVLCLNSEIKCPDWQQIYLVGYVDGLKFAACRINGEGNRSVCEEKVISERFGGGII